MVLTLHIIRKLKDRLIALQVKLYCKTSFVRRNDAMRVCTSADRYDNSINFRGDGVDG